MFQPISHLLCHWNVVYVNSDEPTVALAPYNLSTCDCVYMNNEMVGEEKLE